MEKSKSPVFYLHIGANVSVLKRDIVSILDLDSATISKVTRNFVRDAERSGKLITITSELPRSIITTASGKIYLSHISAQTLCERLQNNLL